MCSRARTYFSLVELHVYVCILGLVIFYEYHNVSYTIFIIGRFSYNMFSRAARQQKDPRA